MYLTTLCLFLCVTVGINKGLECSAGCNPENGYCENPGECRCHPGWHGATCNQCVPFPGCLHGSCQHAWQCVCEEGWVGSQCDQNTNLCSSKPCSGNSTCIQTGEGSYLCVCPPGYTGDSCNLRKNLCLPDSSPCQNGGFCRDSADWAASPSCLCPPGFSGDFCEMGVADSCHSNPCLHGGSCIWNHQNQTFKCTCTAGYTGFICDITDTSPSSPTSSSPSSSSSSFPSSSSSSSPSSSSPSSSPLSSSSSPSSSLVSSSSSRSSSSSSSPYSSSSTSPFSSSSSSPSSSSSSACASQPCAHGASCVSLAGGAVHCVCRPGFSGATCSHQHKARKVSRPGGRPSDHQGLPLSPQHYSLPANAFHKLLRPPERDLLKITMKERVQGSGGLVTQGQLLCFGLLGLLTCLVILGTTAIVFFGRCEAWLANARYTQLVHHQREQLLREVGREREEGGHSVNIILPEKIKLTSFGRHYTSI